MGGSHFRWYAPRRRIEDTVRLAAGSRAESVLEVGCGDAVLLAAVVDALPARPKRVVGLDLAAGRLARARFRVDGAFACAAAEALPLRSRTFDLVLCAEVLEHLGEPAAAIAELARVVRPGGRVIVSVPVVGWSRWIEARITGRVRFLDEQEHVREYCETELPRCERIAALIASLEHAGLRVTAERGVYALPHRGERVWHTLLARGPLAAPARALDRALGAGPARRWSRWLLLEARAA